MIIEQAVVLHIFCVFLHHGHPTNIQNWSELVVEPSSIHMYTYIYIYVHTWDSGDTWGYARNVNKLYTIGIGMILEY